MIRPLGSDSVYGQTAGQYLGVRCSDPLIAASITAAIGRGHSIVNVWAGAGSYERELGVALAVDPSDAMLRQRGADAAPALRARAEQLPLPDGSFDVSLALLTIHHWDDLERDLPNFDGSHAARWFCFTRIRPTRTATGSQATYRVRSWSGTSHACRTSDAFAPLCPVPARSRCLFRMIAQTALWARTGAGRTSTCGPK